MRTVRGRRHFRFDSVWRLPFAPERVYGALASPGDYPRWWPQVRGFAAAGGQEGVARFRSVLPYELRVEVRPRRRDPDAGVLEIAMSGDLEGWARFTVRPDVEPGRCRAEYAQEVMVCGRVLGALAGPARPLLRANHAWMMRGGERGLRSWLERGLDQG